MKIKSLEIYGYGRFVERKIDFDDHITEIYGENETGKSTIQAFIHSILFGFPTKKENEPRLEPRMGNQYGGKLTLIQDDGSQVEVERIKGSAVGDRSEEQAGRIAWGQRCCNIAWCAPSFGSGVSGQSETFR